MNKNRILVVEDEEFLRQLYVNILGEEGYIVEEAKDGEEAYQLLTQKDYDLILLDFQIPKLNGGQILENLKTKFPAKKIGRIIIMSNMDKDSIESKGLNSENVKGYMVKSDYTPDQFIAEVKKFLI
jgi:CheY-like chemotaxis protein